MKILQTILWTYKFGFVNLYHKLRNRFMFDTPVSKTIQISNTSISDSLYLPKYPLLCDLAAKDDAIFSQFRRANAMYDVLDHVSIDQGRAYIAQIIKSGTWNDAFTDAIKSVDRLGSPRKYKFHGYGTFSPTLLRYLKVYVDLINNFGFLSNLHITEIGGGFGGQASLNGLLGTPLSQTIYDIAPVLELAKKFINRLQIPGTFIFKDGVKPYPSKSDLVISNYAFCELNRDMQDLYLKNLILPSPRGYITWNSLSADNFNNLFTDNNRGYSLAELVRLIPNSQIIPEVPLTSPSNAIVVWGNLK